MTISIESVRTSAVGTGAEQIVPFTFPITNNSDIVVTSRVITTGVETTLTETTNYTVTNNGESGGSITTVTPFVANTSQIHIVRDTPNTQTLDLEQGGAFNAENVEDALDKNTKLTAENADALERTLVFPTTDPTSSFSEMPNSVDRASKFLAFDSDGKPTASSEVASTTVTHSAFGTSIAESANALAVRGLVELDTTDDVEFAQITGTTGVFTDIKTKGPEIDVRTYGAVGDDSTNNDTPIANAIAALPTEGGVLVFPDGVYKITVPIEFGDKSIHLKGLSSTPVNTAQAGAVQIKNYGDDNAIEINPNNIVTRSIVENVDIIDGTGARTAGAGIYADRITSGNVSFDFRNVRVSGHYDGFKIVRGVLSKFSQCIAVSNDNHGYYIASDATGSGTSISFENCFANSNTADGYYIDGYTYCAFINCAADSNVNGYTIIKENSVNPNSFSFIGCGAESNTANGIVLTNGDGISNILISGGSIVSSTTDAIVTNDAQNVTIQNVKMVSNGAYGVNADNTAAGNVTLINNNYASNVTAEIKDANNYTVRIADSNTDDIRIPSGALVGMHGTSGRITFASGSILFSTSAGEAFRASGLDLQINGDLNHDGTQVGFYGTAPINQAVLATGSTNDQIITALQNLGLVKQS